MSRSKHTLGPFVAFHGCDEAVGESVLAGKAKLKPSENEYDWLGPGTYFWVDSPERGLAWAQELSQRKRGKTKTPSVKTPFVIGALIHPGLCLNLTDYGVMQELADAHKFLASAAAKAKADLPKNTHQASGVFLRRSLDCAVIKTVHELREEAELDPYDTVYGVFEEGEELYPGAGFKKRTHVQIAVRNPDCIIGYFRVAGV
ncbi:MAG: hypothetical protein E6R07_08960 [Nevskiaceae bacterium]|nr:MAG: hypothetical protein E6R07_08960 [Nevskiaceae bacterium]